MDSTTAVVARRRRDLIGLLPARNLHHGIRLAKNIGFELNQFVTLNFENPGNRCLNAHWLVHVPELRQNEFEVNLERWLWAATGEVLDAKAIHIRPADHPTRAEKYMLKGMHSSLAKRFGIEYTNQGWVTGRRIGHSRNLGPVQVAEKRRQGKYPPSTKMGIWSLLQEPLGAFRWCNPTSISHRRLTASLQICLP